MPIATDGSADMDGVSVEDVLVRAAQRIARSSRSATEEPAEQAGAVAEQADDEHPIAVDTGLDLYVRLNLGGQARELMLPPAAVFLRTPPDTRGALARELQQAWGPDDGRLVPAFDDLANRPEDTTAMAAVGRLAVTAPWRWFRIEPRTLLRWGSFVSPKFPNDVDDLRALLSEPPEFELDNEQLSFHDFLRARVTDGAWQGRLDVRELAIQCAEIPGQPHVALNVRFTPETAGAEFERALARLGECSHHPIARVATDLAFAAPGAVIGEELRRRVSAQVADALAATVEPAANTLAVFEPALLTAARGVVSRLSNRGGPSGRSASRLEQVWLTWRLYQWIIRQLEHLDPATRLAHMRALVDPAPALPGFHPVNDLLDPVRYGRDRLDIRLIAFLHSLCILRPGALRLLSSDSFERTLETLSAREPTREEREAETFPEQPALFGWGPVPRTIPALASRLLVALREVEGEPDDPDRESGTETV